MAIDFGVAGTIQRPRSVRFRYDLIGPFVLLSDIVIIVGSAVLCAMAYGSIAYGGIKLLSTEALDSLALGALFAILFVLLAQIRGLYQPIELLRPLRQVSHVLALWLGVACFLMVIGFTLKMEHALSRGATISFAVIGPILVSISRFFWNDLMNRALASGSFATRPVALIGRSAQFDKARLPRRLAPFGLAVAASVRLPAGKDLTDETLDDIVAQAAAALRGSHIQEIIVSLEGLELSQAERLIAGLRILPLPIKLMLDSAIGGLVSRPTQSFGGLVAVEMQRAPMSWTERSLKRALDVVVATGALLALSPLLVMVALVIRLETPGPILFRQSRTGFNNRPFKILKFRSMRVMEDGGTVRQASRDDDRVTKVGRWIRKLSIDELPQLWNVLRGEMSIVGPRPHALAHDEYYEQHIGDYPYRQHVKPGLTGWAQVNGSRGETPTTESMAERVRLDIWYVENSSIWLDLRIIARTFATVLNVKHTY